jgi:beta-mannanase
MTTLRRARRRSAVALAIALVASSVSWATVVPGRAAIRDPVAALVPASGAHLGIFYGSGTAGATDRRIGAVPRVHLTYYGWRDDWATARSTRADLAADRIPLVNWEPVGVDFDDIVAGRYDALLARRADAARRLGRPFLLDFAAEMNEEEGWGGHDPARYVAAWRHIHDVFRDRGADNVAWVWAPNNTDSPDAPSATAYYPGDAYVDWTGIDGYNWGTSRPGFAWQSFGQVFGPMYAQLAKLRKPIIIGETASDETGGSKARWIAALPNVLRRYPRIKALVWFDIRKERRWQIDSSASARRAFRRIAADPYFNPPPR